MILEEIVAHKQAEVAQAQRLVSLRELQMLAEEAPPPRNFAAVLRGPKVRVIAELKRASPSEGRLVSAGDLWDPRIIAQEYSGSGAAALSVLTDEKYFDGELFTLRRARRYMPLPVLRKDFILSEYQVWESRVHFADALLLIARLLSDEQLRDYLDLATQLGMGALVESHDERDMERVAGSGATVVGINNRDLDTLAVDLATTQRLAPLAPRDCVLVSESGIATEADVARLAQMGVQAVLVGTALVRAPDPHALLRRLSGVYRPGYEPAPDPQAES